jgi:spore photoproduct lyase
MPVKYLFIDPSVADHPNVERFAVNLGLKAQLLDDPNDLFQILKESADPWKMGKEVLWLTRNKGAFIKKCPGTRDYLCCDYQIMHIGTYCTMDCAYCILQGYFHPPVLQYFLNHDDLIAELDSVFASQKTMRIGTGEFTDSLIWENWSELTPQIVRRFADQDISVLELKTKTVAIDRLKGLHHNRKTILSWSLNTPRVIREQERGTSSLQARLRAAAQCLEWGYPLSFHFDPMVIYPNCHDEYLGVLDSLFKQINADAIVWISMGTFRFMPALQPIIKRRFPDSAIIYGEFVPGLDNKMRYFRELRIDLYQRMAQWLSTHAPNLRFYLCMESETIWQRSFGFSPQAFGGLGTMLDESARVHCGIR